MLVRGAIAELRLPRLCASRQCRRHKTCRDIADRDPRCVASLHPLDLRQLSELVHMAADILEGRYPPRPSDDPLTGDREDEAIQVLFDCYDDLPWYQDHILSWNECYDPPPEPPAPPAVPVRPLPDIDTGALLAEMKEQLERHRIIDETRAETEALWQRIAASRAGGA